MKIKKIKLTISSFAFENKDINSFKTVDEFENYFNSYTKEYLNNGFGEQGSIV